jgi:uncharacterized BrkB/YihY/UPF0761 family membrane protein
MKITLQLISFVILMFFATAGFMALYDYVPMTVRFAHPIIAGIIFVTAAVLLLTTIIDSILWLLLEEGSGRAKKR